MKRPTCITVIGVIFIIAGSHAAWGIVKNLFHHRLNLNFAVFMIPNGFGLLLIRHYESASCSLSEGRKLMFYHDAPLIRGLSSSRMWAKFWIGLLSLVVGVLLVLYPFFGNSYSVTWLNEQMVGVPRHAVAIGFPIVFLSFTTLMWRSLSSPSAAPFFDDYILPDAGEAATGLPPPPSESK
jgi:hypothetical protein